MEQYTMQYTKQQIEAVIAYNATNNIFKVTNKRVTWDVRRIDVTNLQQVGVAIITTDDFAMLKKQVRKQLVASNALVQCSNAAMHCIAAKQAKQKVLAKTNKQCYNTYTKASK